MADPAKPFTAKTLAEHWGCSEMHIYNLTKSGKLKHFKIGRLTRIPQKCVEEYEWQNLSNTNGPQTGSSDTETVVEATERFQRAQVIKDMPKK